MSSVRRLPLGVRACDRQGCWHPWPCPTHGTLMMGARPEGVQLNRSGGDALMFRIAVGEPVGSCKRCGYHVCSCATPLFGVDRTPAPERLAGHVVTDDPRTWVPGETRLRTKDHLPSCYAKGEMATFMQPGYTKGDLSDYTVHVMMDRAPDRNQCYFHWRFEVVCDA